MVPFFNALLKKGVWPSLWTISKIAVLPKNVAKVATPADTRGCHMLSVLSKWFMNIFVRRLQRWKGFNLFQAGFVRAARTTDHVFLLYVLLCIARFEKYFRVRIEYVEGHQNYQNVGKVSVEKSTINDHCKLVRHSRQPPLEL